MADVPKACHESIESLFRVYKLPEAHLRIFGNWIALRLSDVENRRCPETLFPNHLRRRRKLSILAKYGLACVRICLFFLYCFFDFHRCNDPEALLSLFDMAAILELPGIKPGTQGGIRLLRRDQYRVVEAIGGEAGYDLQIIPVVFVAEGFSDPFLDLLRYIVKRFFLAFLFCFVSEVPAWLIFPDGCYFPGSLSPIYCLLFLYDPPA